MNTDHALGCPHCVDRHPWEWKGYVPFYDEEYARRFALISPTYYESVEEIDHLAPIVITRGKKDTDQVVIKQINWRTTPIPPAAERFNAVDLMRFLVFTLWKSRELQEFAAKTLTATLPGMDLNDEQQAAYEVGKTAAKEMWGRTLTKDADKQKERDQRQRMQLEELKKQEARQNGKPKD